jgi:hypothetical protein
VGVGFANSHGLGFVAESAEQIPAVSGSPRRLRTPETNVHFSHDVAPLLCLAKHGDELVERRLMLRSELEPGEEIERLAEIAPVMQAARDSRQIGETAADVPRSLFEDRAPLVLSEARALSMVGSAHSAHSAQHGLRIRAQLLRMQAVRVARETGPHGDAHAVANASWTETSAGRVALSCPHLLQFGERSVHFDLDEHAPLAAPGAVRRRPAGIAAGLIAARRGLAA